MFLFYRFVSFEEINTIDKKMMNGTCFYFYKNLLRTQDCATSSSRDRITISKNRQV